MSDKLEHSDNNEEKNFKNWTLKDQT
jgi:hypothetical protein